MLNRRVLRVKAFQAIYAYWQTDGADAAVCEMEMLKGLSKIRDLYFSMLTLLPAIVDVAEQEIEQRKIKRLPTEADLNPNLRFVQNQVVAALVANPDFKIILEQKKYSWADDIDIVRKVFRAVRDSHHYEEYMASDKPGFELDRSFLSRVFKKIISQFDLVHHLMEERDIHWHEDIIVVNQAIARSMDEMSSKAQHLELVSLYKDEKQDKAFVKALFRKTITHGEGYNELISEKAKNWEMDRIATLDVILMKMALCEMEHFPTIPVKVTMNEYIELAKNYSTPKSRSFINGILDKALESLKAEGKVKKSGKGLINT